MRLGSYPLFFRIHVEERVGLSFAKSLSAEPICRR